MKFTQVILGVLGVLVVACYACSDCPSVDTCCPIGGGQNGCCPYTNAVCCSDNQHCCPNGYTCNLSTGECTGNGAASLRLKRHAKVTKPLACPAGECSPTETCCDLGNGVYGCCPYVDAICCADHQHCCPSGYTCDVSKGQCVSGAAATTQVVAELAKVSVKRQGQKPATDCPAGTCPTGDTCCSMPSGGWGCCPYPNADCCTDGQHCCPNGYVCDFSKQECVKSVRTTGVKVTKAMASLTTADCTATSCSSSETCCSLGNGQIGCCPFPNAQCCADHAHCCPSGYTCNVSQGQCVHSNSGAFSEAIRPSRLRKPRRLPGHRQV